MKILDYYYLVLLRGYGKLTYRVTGLMAITVAANIFSLAILFDHHIIAQPTFLIAFFILGLVIMIIFDITYSKKRRERIKEQYKDEHWKSRQHGVVKVVVYEVLSLALLIWALTMVEITP